MQICFDMLAAMNGRVVYDTKNFFYIFFSVLLRPAFDGKFIEISRRLLLGWSEVELSFNYNLLLYVLLKSYCNILIE